MATFTAPTAGKEVITATDFYKDATCTTKGDAGVWDLDVFKTASGYSSLAADTKVSFAAYVDKTTPYIADMTEKQIHIVKVAKLTDEKTA